MYVYEKGRTMFKGERGSQPTCLHGPGREPTRSGQQRGRAPCARLRAAASWLQPRSEVGRLAIWICTCALLIYNSRYVTFCKRLRGCAPWWPTKHACGPYLTAGPSATYVPTCPDRCTGQKEWWGNQTEKTQAGNSGEGEMEPGRALDGRQLEWKSSGWSKS